MGNSDLKLKIDRSTHITEIVSFQTHFVYSMKSVSEGNES